MLPRCLPEPPGRVRKVAGEGETHKGFCLQLAEFEIELPWWLRW